MKELVLSQEGAPKMHQMTSQIAKRPAFIARCYALVHADSFGFRRLCLLPPYTWFLQVCFQPRRGRRRPCLLSLCGAVPDVH